MFHSLTNIGIIQHPALFFKSPKNLRSDFIDTNPRTSPSAAEEKKPLLHGVSGQNPRGLGRGIRLRDILGFGMFRACLCLTVNTCDGTFTR